METVVRKIGNSVGAIFPKGFLQKLEMRIQFLKLMIRIF